MNLAKTFRNSIIRSGWLIRSVPVAVLTLLAASLAYALEDYQVRVLYSDGTPLESEAGLQVKGYNGASHRGNANFAGDGIFEFEEGIELTHVVLRRHYINSSNQPLGEEISLVDFRVDVRTSDYQGDSLCNVNHGLSLYQGSSHRANFAAPDGMGMYHHDVVPGATVRARVRKDYISAYTETVDPDSSTGTDALMQLVDFRVDFNTVECDSLSLQSVQLYQGGSHRANFSFDSPALQVHHDVVPGAEVRARVRKNYISVYSETVDPDSSAGTDVLMNAPWIYFRDLTGTGSTARLYQGGSHRGTLSSVEPGLFRIKLLDGMSNLHVICGIVITDPFEVNSGQTVLASTPTHEITLEAGNCEQEQEQQVAVELLDFNGVQTAGEQVLITWSTAQESNLVGFRLWRDGFELEGYIPAAGDHLGHDYEYVDGVPGAGLHQYMLQELSGDGSSTDLGTIEVEVDPLPVDYELCGAFPNPFNPSTVIQFSLPEEMDIDLRIFSILGQQVAVLASGSRQAGRHQVLFEGGDKASGVYIAVMNSSMGRRVLKMMLVK